MNNIEFFVGLGLLFWFFSCKWPNLMVDWGRQALFEVRDSLFLLASSGKVQGFGFDDPLYRDMRSEINMINRYLEYFCWGRVWLFSLMGTQVDRRQSRSSVVKSILEIEDIALRDRLLGDMLRVCLTVISVMVLRNPLMLAFAMVLTPCIALLSFWRNGQRKMLGLISRSAGMTDTIIASSSLRPAGHFHRGPRNAA